MIVSFFPKFVGFLQKIFTRTCQTSFLQPQLHALCTWPKLRVEDDPCSCARSVLSFCCSTVGWSSEDSERSLESALHSRSIPARLASPRHSLSSVFNRKVSTQESLWTLERKRGASRPRWKQTELSVDNWRRGKKTAVHTGGPRPGKLYMRRNARQKSLLGSHSRYIGLG